LTFEEHVAQALASLPPELREAVRNVEITVEDEHPDDPDLFGLYEGVPLPERGDWAGLMPDRIRVFRLPLVESFPDPAELEEEIRITLLTTSGSTRTGSTSWGTPDRPGLVTTSSSPAESPGGVRRFSLHENHQ
jgi:Zincin-like metallopeptidase